MDFWLNIYVWFKFIKILCHDNFMFLAKHQLEHMKHESDTR